MADLKIGEYQSALKMLNAADGALQHAMSGVRRHEDQSVLRRRIEDIESYVKKAKRELRLA